MTCIFGQTAIPLTVIWRSHLTFPLKQRWQYLLAAAAGAFYFLGFVGFDQWYLSWFCLVPIFFALEGVTPKHGLILGWFSGTVALTSGFYWITYTIHVFAYMPWIVSGLGCLLLSIAQATEFALFGFLYTWLKKRTGLGTAFLGTICFVSAEFISPQLFPHYLANSQYLRIPLIQICDITGVTGLTTLIVFVNGCIYLVIKSLLQERRFRWPLATAAAAAVLLVLAYGYWRLPQVNAEMEISPKLRFGIAQANLGIREKNLYPERALVINKEQTLKLKELGADIVIWPETAVQAPILQSDLDKLPDEVFDKLDIPILIGALQREYDKKPRMYNVGVLADEKGEILGVYKKQKLLMLGEYIPLGETFPKLHQWFPYIGRLTPGTSNQPLEFHDFLLSVNICYEDILPRLINRMISYSPHVIINLTNDNWFGRTREPPQHLVLAAFRSVEHRRWLVRSTNTGISAFVDATGRIIKQSPLMEPNMLIHDVPMMSSKTFYSRFGDWFGWLCIVTVFVCALFVRRRPDRKNRSKSLGA